MDRREAAEARANSRWRRTMCVANVVTGNHDKGGDGKGKWQRQQDDDGKGGKGKDGKGKGNDGNRDAGE